MQVDFFTVCWTRQLPNALQLADQLRTIHPESILWIGLVDVTPGISLPVNVRLVEFQDIPDTQALASRYTKTEVLHISRVLLAKKLLDTKALLFLEPETSVVRPLQEFVTALESAPAVLCSQWLRPHPDTHFPDSKYFLNYGTFFSGIWGIRPSPITTDFLNWWSQNLITRGQYNTCEGLASDQLWLDLAPTLFAGVLPIRNPAYGIHSGNAFDREGHHPATLHFGGVSYASGTFPSYRFDRALPSYYSQALQAYVSRIKAQPEFQMYATKEPAYGLPDPPEPVSLSRQRWAQSIRKLVKKINQYQPDFLFRQ